MQLLSDYELKVLVIAGMGLTYKIPKPKINPIPIFLLGGV